MSSGNSSAVQHHRNLGSFKDIRSAGDDLDRFRSHIHLTDLQFICIRVFFYGNDLADDDLIQIFIKHFISFHLRTGESHRIPELLIGTFKFRHI